MRPIWIVDDDRSIRWVLEKALARENLPCKAFGVAQDVLEELEHDSPQVLVSDIRMPGMNGIELLRAVKRKHPALPVIIMTAFSDLESAVSAFQGGAFEYLPKPFDVDKAVELIRRAVDESERESRADEAPTEVPEILGQAPSMQEVFRAIGRLSQSNVTVLLTGESGSGKEVVARALHKHSQRADKPFIALNMAAIPRDLLESELFGHERGAFTGAQAMRRGRFEQAEGGTLFLDEIGDMPAELQTRLLRVLSDGFYYRVGGHQPIKADVRVIAATHQNLEERVRQGLFREDLYHRLNVIRLRLPSLRERREDIPLLAKHFLAKQRARTGRRAEEAVGGGAAVHQPDAVSGQRAAAREPVPLAHGAGAGPGREGRGPAARRARGQLADGGRRAGQRRPSGGGGRRAAPAAGPVLAGGADWIAQLTGEVERRLQAGVPDVMDALTRDFEAAVIRAALRHTHGRRIDAATRLGVGRNTITRKIQDLKLED